jgi:RNA polymerase sigma-70 factor (ECF subfamily)
VSEPELIIGLQKGEGKAHKFVYEKYAGLMLGICLRYLKNHMDAEEVMLNGFVKIFQNAGQFENKGSFEGWMKRVVVNEALGYLRKKEPLHLAIEKDHIQLPTEATAESDLAVEDLLNLLQELPAGYRTVFNMYAIEGYTHKEIAAMLEITEGTSKSQLSKARALLQKRLVGQELNSL